MQALYTLDMTIGGALCTLVLQRVVRLVAEVRRGDTTIGIESPAGEAAVPYGNRRPATCQYRCLAFP